MPASLSLVTGLDVAEVTSRVRGQVLRVSRDTAGREVRHKAETLRPRETLPTQRSPTGDTNQRQRESRQL
jgi:hypothetical protein